MHNPHSSHSKSDMLLGALVADAACLGLHWLYDADRIAKIAEHRGAAAFTPVDAKHFDGAKGYFAHSARQNGMLTQYGEALWVAIRTMNTQNGTFDVAAQQAAFAAHFGPGGAFTGYIDRPTRGALERIADNQTPSGIDDDQNPALSRLPVVIAAYHGTSELADMARAAMQITNVNDVADGYTTVFIDLLGRVLDGEPLDSALVAAADNAQGDIQAALRHALTTQETDSTVFTGEVGRACHLPTSGPAMFHILKHSSSYAEAVERNVLAGGDSAGRAIPIGAAMGAAQGVATPSGIPLAWVLKLTNGATIWDGCTRLGSA